MAGRRSPDLLPDVDAAREGPGSVVVGTASGPEVARRSAEALADRLGHPAVELSSHHAGSMADPAGSPRPFARS